MNTYKINNINLKIFKIFIMLFKIINNGKKFPFF